MYRHAIAVNQAWAGYPGHTFPLHSSTDTVTLEDPYDGAPLDTVPSQQAWYKPLPDGGAAIFVVNHGTASAAVTIDFNDVPSLGPPAPPAYCDAAAFVDLGDTQCFGLQGPTAIGGQMVNSSEACCAACSAAGAACETWGWCDPEHKCATEASGNPTPGCFIGKYDQEKCPKKKDGWVAQNRKPGPMPHPPPAPAPPASPKMFTVTDVWEQAPVSGSNSSYTVPALASHDSIFITVAPA